MKTQQETLEAPIRIVGVAATIEKADVQAQIGALWERANAAGVLRPGEPAYAAYYGYEDRLANRYRVLVGARSDAEPGDGQEAVELPAGDYVALTDHGEAIPIAQAMWKHVWTRLDHPERRTFEVDFERYDGTPTEADVALFIGVDG